MVDQKTQDDPECQSGNIETTNENKGLTIESLAKLRFYKISARIKATWFWQVFGICAMQRLWTKFMLAIVITSFFPLAIASLDLLTPIYNLNEMDRAEGVLLVARQPLRGRYGSKIIIRKDNGKKIIYIGTIRDREEERLHTAIGSRVTVWSQIVCTVRPPFVYEQFWHVKTGNKVLIDYDSWKPGREYRRSNVAPPLFGIALAMIIFPLLIVYFFCRKLAAKAYSTKQQ